MRALLLLFLLLPACAVQTHREARYGPGAEVLSTTDPEALDAQIASVDFQVSGIEMRIAALSAQIKDRHNPGDVAEKEKLEKQLSELKTKRTSLQGTRNSMQGRATVPAN